MRTPFEALRGNRGFAEIERGQFCPAMGSERAEARKPETGRKSLGNGSGNGRKSLGTGRPLCLLRVWNTAKTEGGHGGDRFVTAWQQLGGKRGTQGPGAKLGRLANSPPFITVHLRPKVARNSQLSHMSSFFKLKRPDAFIRRREGRPECRQSWTFSSVWHVRKFGGHRLLQRSVAPPLGPSPFGVS